jgi:Concanavalin A-like lectin/glucanases superfamily
MATHTHLRFHWSFDTGGAGPAQDWAASLSDSISGWYNFVPGVSKGVTLGRSGPSGDGQNPSAPGGGRGLAVRFDGFTSHLERKAGPAVAAGSLSVAAWIAPGAYPWRHSPVLDMAPGENQGFCLSLDSSGHMVFAIALGGTMVALRSPEALALNQWHQVAGVYEAGTGLSLYVNGVVVATLAHKGLFQPAADGSVLMGRSREPLTGSGAIRYASHLPIHNYLDALVDDVRVWEGVLSAAEISKEFAAALPLPAPQLPARVLPMGKPGQGKFGAYYTHLKYYDAWDRRWRVGDHPDVVVRFDDEDYRLVFWRGTNYIPCWASAEGIWYTNEFNETWGHGATGCAEPMSDKHCAYSHVRIIESNDARCVVHWRYALVDVKGVRPRKDPITGWSDWSDEIHTIYPDGTGTRKITLHSTMPLDPHEFQETIMVLGPGQTPGDVVEAEALTMANMRGEEYTYSWDGGAPAVIDKPDKCNIQLVNSKSETRPFLIVSDKNCLKRNLEPSDRPVFPVYRNEIRAPQLFPWWNHWPTAELPSDGRYAEAADRAAHSSLLTGMEWEDYEVTPTSRSRVHLQGLTRQKATALVPLARSWLAPAIVDIQSAGITSQSYEVLERAYHFNCADGVSSLSFDIAASRSSPVVNLALVIKNWQGAAAPGLRINKTPISAGPDYRVGHRSTLASEDLIIWIRLQSETLIQIEIGADQSSVSKSNVKSK